MYSSIRIKPLLILCVFWLMHDCAAQEQAIKIVPQIFPQESYLAPLLPQDRWAELERLSSLLLEDNWNSESDKRKEIVQSLKRAGYINANALAPLIVNYLDFHVSELGYAGVPVNAIPSDEEIYPAIYALKQMGASSFGPIIDSFATPKRSPLFISNGITTMRAMTDEHTNSTVRSTLKSSSEEFTRRAKRLRLLAKAIDGQSAENSPAKLNALFPEAVRRAEEKVQTNTDDVLNAAKAGDFKGIIRLFDIYAKHPQNASAAFLSQYLDLQNPKDRTYPAVDALITLGPQGLSEVARQISASRKNETFVFNGMQVLQRVSDNTAVVQTLNNSAIEFEEQSKFLLSLSAKLK